MKLPESHNRDHFPDLLVYFLKTRQQVKAVNAHMQNDRFILLLVRKGKVQFQMNGHVALLQAGELLIVPKDSFCTIIGIDSRPYIGLLSFTRAFAFVNMVKNDQPDLMIFFRAKNFPILKLEDEDISQMLLLLELLDIMSNNAKNSGPDDQLVRLGFYILLWKLTYLYYRPYLIAQNKYSRKHELVKLFFNAIREHYKDEHLVKFYADLLYVSADYLSKTVKQITDKPAKSFLQEFLVKEAKGLLLEQKSIAVISRDLGFSSKYHFSNFFKKHTSISPSAYRKKLNTKNPK